MATKQKQAKHTPGPWKSMASSYNSKTKKITSYGIHATGGSSRWIASIEFASGVDVEDEANARLIAAAPDMEKEIEELEKQKADLVEAAKYLLEAPEIKKCPMGRWSSADPDNYSRAKRLQTAIAKAEGQEE